MYVIFVSSLNENVKLAKRLQNQLKEFNKESEIINVVTLNLPMYDTHKEEHEGIPHEAKKLNEKMKSSDGFIMVAPEYNFSVPPVLANMIVWVSRVDEDFREPFKGKLVQLATHSGGGGNDLMDVMRMQLTKLGSIVMPNEIITTYQKEYMEQSVKDIIKEFIS